MEHYLDNAATTKPCQEAVQAMQQCVTENYGNPSSLHAKGLAAEHEITRARASIARALNCNSDEILFTSGATESNNLALQGIAQNYGKRRKKIVSSAVEHASVKQTLTYLQSLGYEIVTIKPREDGAYYADDFIQAVDDNTCLLSMMLFNNETGYRMPVEEVFRAVKRKYPSLITHCDAVQGFLKVPIHARTLYADLISISAHKVHAIKGVGALYCKKGIRLRPILYGGHQEKNIRPGTESVPLIAAFGAAVDALEPTIHLRFDRACTLRDYAIEQLQSIENLVIRDSPQNSPYILNISVLGYRSETLLHYLEQQEIYVSSGSACSKGATSGVLEAFGATAQEVDSALRISLSAESTQDDITAFVQTLSQAKANLVH